MKGSLRHFCLLVVLFMGFSASALAADASLSGVVRAGNPPAPIRGAHVTLRVKGRVLEARTDDEGKYHFDALAINEPYALTIEADGLSAFTQAKILLHDGELRTLDARLSVAGVSESVSVSDKLLEADSHAAQISETVSAEQLQNLPTVTHSVTKAALLDPHVRQAIGLGSDFADANRLSINAGSYRNTAYMLDGTTTYDWTYSVMPIETIGMDATRELKVLTGDYSAQYGISTTGVLVVTSKAGGSQYHGDAFAFIRPSGIQANVPLVNSHIPNAREYWGASLGGPLFRKRTNLFASYEGAQQDRGSYIQGPVPGYFDGHTTEYYSLLRLDHELAQNHSLTGRFNGNHYQSNNVNDRIAALNQASTGRYARGQGWGGQISETSVFGDKINQVRFSFVDYEPDSAVPLQKSVGVVRPNYSTEGYSTTNWVHAQSYALGDLLSIHEHRNDWKAGGELSWLRVKDYSTTPYGTYTFASGPPQEGEHPLSYSQTFGTADLRYGQEALNAFAEDTLQVAPRLTATLGLRYEFQTLTDSHANFAPRAGLAWDITGKGKTVLRASSGLFWDQYYWYIARRFKTFGVNAPQASYSFTYGEPGFPTFPDSMSELPAGKVGGKLDLYLRADKLSNPYSLQTSLSLEQQFPHGLTLTLSGMHAHTLHQMRVNDINHPEPFIRTAPGQYRGGTLSGAAAAANATRPYQTWEGLAVRDIAVIENTASSIYDAFDVGVKQRVGPRFEYSAHYVLSNSIAYAMFYADANSGVPNEWNDLGDAERGPGDFYQRNRFVGNGWAQLPLRSQLAFVVTAASGLPVNPITGDDNNGDSYSVDRPVGYGRNSFRTPPQASVDLALSKRVQLFRKLEMEGRVEADNVLNHSNFISVNNVFGEGATPLATFLSPKSGITNSDPGRQLQLAARFFF